MRFLSGMFGVTAVQGIAMIPTDGIPITEIIKVVIQAAIGVATVVHMFKKPKNPSN